MWMHFDVSKIAHIQIFSEMQHVQGQKNNVIFYSQAHQNPTRGCLIWIHQP